MSSTQNSLNTNIVVSTGERLALTDTASSSTSARLGYTGAADTGLTASTEASSINFNLGQIRQHATGTLAIQRDIRIIPAVHSFAGASTITTAASLNIDGPPSGGTNATLTSAYALNIMSLAITNTTNGYALSIKAPTGATNNFALKQSGYTVNTGGTVETIAAGAGAGTGPTITIAGAAGLGVITLTTGTLPSLSSIIATITYGQTFPTGSIISLSPANANAALLSGAAAIYISGTTNKFTLNSGNTPLTAATQYIWNYHISGY